MRKHTSFNLKDALSIGVDNMQRNFAPMVEDVQRWHDTVITDTTAKLIIYEAFVEGGMEIPRHLLRPTHDLYFQPVHEEFMPRTLWSLNNRIQWCSKATRSDPSPTRRRTNRPILPGQETLARTSPTWGTSRGLKWGFN